MQKLVFVSHTVRAHVGGPENLGTQGPRHSDGGRGSPVKNTSLPTCVTLPDLVAVGQTFSEQVGSPKILWTLKPRPVWNTGVSDPCTYVLLHLC